MAKTPDTQTGTDKGDTDTSDTAKTNPPGSSSSPAASLESPESKPRLAIQAAKASAPDSLEGGQALTLAGNIATESLSAGLASLQNGGSANAAAAAVAGTATAAAVHVLEEAMSGPIGAALDQLRAFRAQTVETIDQHPLLRALVDFLEVRFPHDTTALRQLLDPGNPQQAIPAPAASSTSGIPMAAIGAGRAS